MQEHLLVKTTLMCLTFDLRVSPPLTFKPNGMIVKLMSSLINFMWIRATMLSVWDIWYYTHKILIKELVGYPGYVFILLSERLLTSNISISKSESNETEQPNLSTNQVNITSFAFLFTRTPNWSNQPLPPLLRRQLIHMEEIHGMAWGQRQRWSNPTLKDGGFDGLHSSVTVHVVNLSLNLLTLVTIISSAMKFLTELRIGFNYFDSKPPSNNLKLDQIKKLYILKNPVISVNVPSNIGNMTGLVDMELSFTSLNGNIPFEFGLLKDLRYLSMDETHIHGHIPVKLENMQHIKYLSIESSQPNTRF